MKKITITLESHPFIVNEKKIELDINSYSKKKKSVAIDVQSKSYTQMIGGISALKRCNKK
jgi:hypothetical protein